MSPSILSGLLLIEIASTFNTSVGVAAQVRTASSTISMIFAVFMGVLSIKVKHRTLMLAGASILLVSSLLCPLSNSFAFFALAYSLVGFSSAFLTPIGLSLVGEHLSADKRGQAISWIISGAALTYVIGAPVISRLSSLGGWRFAFLGYAVPVVLITLIVFLIGIPKQQEMVENPTISIFSGFKAVMGNYSAVSCMMANALIGASYQAILYFGSSFFRQFFEISRDFASLMIVGSALTFVFGTQIAGKIVNHYGRKNVSVYPALIAGIIILTYMNVFNVWASMILRFLGSFFVAVAWVASRSLTLEQVPGFRGTMMSLNSAAQSLGAVVGTGVGGILLLNFSYQLVGIVLGFFGIISGLTYYLFTQEPDVS
jgi:predicted MFS family arabinose efflux permease